jgi:hypothetical protein
VPSAQMVLSGFNVLDRLGQRLAGSTSSRLTKHRSRRAKRR